MDGNPGRIEHGLALVWLLGAVVILSNAAGITMYALAQAFFALFLSVTWGLRAFIARKRRSRILLEHWLVWPGAFVIALALHFTQVPRLVRLKLSEEALTGAMQEHRTGPAGLFTVLEIRKEEDGTYLVTKDYLFGSAGFAFIPSEVPTHVSYFDMRHVVGRWWMFRIRS